MSRAQLPPYHVVLMNSDKITFDHVVTSIMALTPLSHDEAIEKAMEAHQNGRSILLTCHRERAELYKFQFESIEPSILIETEAG